MLTLHPSARTPRTVHNIFLSCSEGFVSLHSSHPATQPPSNPVKKDQHDWVRKCQNLASPSPTGQGGREILMSTAEQSPTGPPHPFPDSVNKLPAELTQWTGWSELLNSWFIQQGPETVQRTQLPKQEELAAGSSWHLLGKAGLAAGAQHLCILSWKIKI